MELSTAIKGGLSLVSAAVIDYLRRENRPYSLTDIHNNLHREHGKTAVQQALDALIIEKLVRQKDNGKQKIFVAVDTCNQPATTDVVNALDERLSVLRTQTELLNSEKQAKMTRANHSSSPLTSEASIVFEQLEHQMAELRHKVSAYAQRTQSNKRQKVMVVEDKEAILKRKALRLTEWRVRKRAVNSIIDAILQQDDFRASRESLYEEIGIETDESVGVSSITSCF